VLVGANLLLSQAQLVVRSVHALCRLWPTHRYPATFQMFILSHHLLEIHPHFDSLIKLCIIYTIMSSPPEIPWVHDSVHKDTQHVEYDEAVTALLTGQTPTLTSHPLDTPTQSVDAAQSRGDGTNVDDAAPPRPSP
jgi:hypothetical protein